VGRPRLLGDRQHMAGPQPLRKALGRALNAMGGHDGYLARAQAEYKALRQRVELKWSDERTVDLVADEGHFCVKADPRGSYGYLYVAAWFDADNIDTATAVCFGQDGYEAEGDARIKWSHPEPPPELGADRHFFMGPGGEQRCTIVGYIDTHGYLAALVVPYEPFCNPERYPVVALYGCDIVDKKGNDDE
jgi:hypothetical protein